MELPDINNIFVWRAIERLINVLIGAMSIFLGYRLFMNLPERRENREGKMKLMLPGDISVYVSRVGPGVFFAIFGTAIILTSFVKTLTFTPPPKAPEAQEEKASTTKTEVVPTSSGLSYVSGTIDSNRINTDRGAIKRDLLSLRKLEAALNQALNANQPLHFSDNETATLLNTLPRIKRSLLLEVWDEEWGNREVFSRWVQEGDYSSPPPDLQQVGTYFQPLKPVETP